MDKAILLTIKKIAHPIFPRDQYSEGLNRVAYRKTAKLMLALSSSFLALRADISVLSSRSFSKEHF